MRKRKASATRATPQALAQLFDQLSLAARSDLPLAEAMEIIVKDTGADPSSRAMLEHVAAAMREGGSLSDGLQRSHGELAPETIALVRRAEAEGSLPAVLQMLARDIEHRARFRVATRGALTWPVASFVVFTIVFIFMAIFAVPVFRNLFTGLGAQLPGPTRILVFVSDVIIKGWFVIVPLALAAGYAWWRYRRRWEWLQSRLDEAVMGTPVIRAYVAKSFVSRLASILLASTEGAPLRESLAHLRATVANKRLAARVRTLESRLEGGASLTQAVAAVPELPGRLQVAVELGERTQRLPQALRQAREISDLEAEHSLVRLEQATLMAAYVIVGFLVGLLVFAMYLPIFKMGSVV